jgi:hypothetical protein
MSTETNIDQIKFTEDELKSLEQLRVSYNRITIAFGDLEVAKIQTEKRLDALSEQRTQLEVSYDEAIQSEKDLVKSLTDKYGPGSLDINTGVFTPVPTNVEPSSEEVETEVEN